MGWGKLQGASTVAFAVAVMAVIAGCGSNGGATPPDAAAIAVTPARYPVTVRSCGKPLVFGHKPARVVTNDVNTSEDMIALGLDHLIVGSFQVHATEPKDEQEPAHYGSALAALPQTTPAELTLEQLQKVHPDLVFAGWNYGLRPHSLETPQYISKLGAQTLVINESCGQVQPSKQGVSMEDTYRDLTSLGAIFGVQARANAVITQMQRQVDAVRAKVADLRPVSVFLYETDPSDPYTALRLGTPTALIQLAGGRNIFETTPGTWYSVRWREIAERKPECIIIDDYSQPSWKQKEALIKSEPAMKDVPAIHNGCIMHLSYDQLTPSPRNGEAVEAIARELHPRAFGLPAHR